MPTVTDWSKYAPYFTANEFRCKCGCGQVQMQESYMDWILELRMIYGKGMAVTSGYRCPDFNNRISSTGEAGPHTTGLAGDYRVDRHNAFVLIGLATNAYVEGLGVAQKGGGRFLHLDLIERSIGPTVWSY